MREQRPCTVVHGDGGRCLRDFEEAGAHGVGAQPSALRYQQGLGVVEREQPTRESYGMRWVQDDDEAVHLRHREKATDRVIEDRLAAQQQKLLRLAIGQTHAPTLPRCGDDHPELFGLRLLHAAPSLVPVSPCGLNCCSAAPQVATTGSMGSSVTGGESTWIVSRTCSRNAAASSSLKSRAYMSSLARILFALVNICFSPVERPLSA